VKTQVVRSAIDSATGVRFDNRIVW
jgi:hypothetical protein